VQVRAADMRPDDLDDRIAGPVNTRVWHAGHGYVPRPWRTNPFIEYAPIPRSGSGRHTTGLPGGEPMVTGEGRATPLQGTRIPGYPAQPHPPDN
jgi:hypothetical protein